MMKGKAAYQNIGTGGIGVIIWVVIIVFSLVVGVVFSQSQSGPPKNTTDDANPAVAAFKKRVKSYVDLRERFRKLSVEVIAPGSLTAR